MHPDFWHERWHDNQIGFHQDAPTTLMLKHWPSLGITPGSRVAVPLAGKSNDMIWLASQGLRVLGIELSPLAVEQFFAENQLMAEITQSPAGHHYRSGDIEIICGDVFEVDEKLLRDCHAVFDRAAVIALPPALRERYVETFYSRLPRQCRGLLITLEYPQDEKDGPPFSVVEAEVRQRYGVNWDVTTLERRDTLAEQSKFSEEGVTALDTVVYRLDRRA